MDVTGFYNGQWKLIRLVIFYLVICNFVMAMVYLLSKHTVRLELVNCKNGQADQKKHYTYKKRV